MSDIIISDNLVLKKYKREYAEILYKFIDEDREYLVEKTGATNNYENIEDFHEKHKKYRENNIIGITFVIFYQNEIIGLTTVTISNNTNTAETSLWLHKNYRSYGIGYKAGSTLNNWIFIKNPKIEKIEKDCYSDNLASCRNIEKQGFHLRFKLDHKNRKVNCYYYTRYMWEKDKKVDKNQTIVFASGASGCGNKFIDVA